MNISKAKSILVNFIDRVYRIYGYKFELAEGPATFFIITHRTALSYNLLGLLPRSVFCYVSFCVVNGFIELTINKGFLSNET